ncbi:MAG TPA: hypothetical protein EYG02_04255 [Henriciella marina]|uniref:hypothetical protein n=1 Tax=Henriciella sp. TaxID=1968823 RepID=UPI0017A731C6|nr:hypothetical protein [Henriciella sp.]HIG23637.1 hypothetical protein [Henriciella sp.]HIK64225.1 hypothetical protein [Henriciella marina]
MQSFEFKPALLRGRDNWTVDSGMLTCNGELYLSFANVTGLHFGELRARQTHSAWLDVETGDRRHRIGCNAPPGDQNYEQFLALCRAIVGEVAEARPDVTLKVGVGGAPRWIFFLLGLAMILAGIAGMAFSQEARGGMELYALIAGGCFAVVGLLIAFIWRPGTGIRKLDLDEARAHLAARSLNPDPAEAEKQGKAGEDGKG